MKEGRRERCVREPIIMEAADNSETVLDSHSVEVPGLSLYYPSRSQSLPKLRAFIELATKRMRRDFQAGDYLANPTSYGLSSSDRRTQNVGVIPLPND